MTSGSSQASFTLDGGSPQSENAKKLEGEVGWVCKTCRLVFASMPMLTLHQKMLQHSKGTLKLTQLMYSCPHCKSTATTALEYRWHLEGEIHKRIRAEAGENQDTDVADVVRQITALNEAAQAEATAKRFKAKDRASDSGETVREVNKNKLNASPLNKVVTSETAGDKPIKETISAPSENAASHSSIKELNERTQVRSEEQENPSKSPSNPKEGTRGSQRNYTENTITSQDAVSNCNDYGYAEHSISFVSNPNYTPSYSYQTSNCYEKAPSEQSMNLTTPYNSYSGSMQLQNYYNQTSQYQLISHSSQNYNYFGRMSEFQNSTPNYCPPNVINQHPPSGAVLDKGVSYFPEHTKSKQENMYPNYEVYQAGYSRPVDSITTSNSTQAQSSYVTSPKNNYGLKSSPSVSESPISESACPSEINAEYKNHQYHQYAVTNDNSRFNYTKETTLTETKDSQKTTKNANINKNVPSSTKV